MRADRARIGWLAETLADRDVADIVGCSRRTVIRVRQELGIPAADSLRPRVNGGLCSVEGCDRGAAARGWCRCHYDRWARSGDVWASVPIQRPGGNPGLAELEAS